MSLSPTTTPGRSSGESAAYLTVLLVGVLVADFVFHVVEGRSIANGSTLVVLILLATLIASGILWWRSTLSRVSDPFVAWPLLLLLAAWVTAMGFSVVRDERLSVLAILVPAVILLTWLKTPSPSAATGSADALAWSLTVVVILGVALEAVGFLPSLYDAGQDPAARVATDESTYWLPISDLVGIDGRWGGQFGHPNLAGPVGSFLVVFGVTRTGLRRIVFVLSGVLVLLLTSSRTSVVAAAAGLFVVVAVAWLRRPGRISRGVKTAVVFAPVVAVVLTLVVINPGLTGRTDMWPAVVDLFRTAPITGVGDSGFAAAIADGRLPSWAIHAHNVVLDAAVRMGLIGLLVVLAVFVASVLGAMRAARQGRAASLALIVMLIVGGLTDVNLHWRYLLVPMCVLLLAILLSATPQTRSADEAPAQ